jgi:DNA-binding transcriptional LysR family regulator
MCHGQAAEGSRIRYGLGSWVGLQADKLMDEEIYPVCSPDVLRQHKRLRQPADLMHETLIHDLSMDGHAEFPTWSAWLQKTRSGFSLTHSTSRTASPGT